MNDDTCPAYDPNRLFNTLLERMKLRSDAALAQVLKVHAAAISRMRHLRLPIGATVLLRIHDISEISIKELRALMGDRRKKFRVSGRPAWPREERSQGQ